MNEKKNYIVTHDFKSPYVMSTGNARNPTRIERRTFKRGQIISGVLIMSDGKPAYVLYGGTFVMPLSNIKEMITKDVSFGIDGGNNKKPVATSAFPEPKKVINTKVKYADGVLIGIVAGVVVSFIGVKKAWFTAPEDKKWLPYAIGAGVGALIGGYIIFRKNNKNKKDAPKEPTK